MVFFTFNIYIGAYPKQNFSLSYEELSPITENIIAYQHETKINR